MSVNGGAGTLASHSLVSALTCVLKGEFTGLVDCHDFDAKKSLESLIESRPPRAFRPRLCCVRNRPT